MTTNPIAWHIASYPRSGNHLVRTLLEAYSNRPTEGSLGSPKDTPIHSKKANAAGIIKINSPEPIGYKSHDLHAIHSRDRSFRENPLGFLLITRDPVAAIASHAMRSLRKKRKYVFHSSQRYDQAINILLRGQINAYLALVYKFSTIRSQPKIHVRFEDLINPETSEQTVDDLLGSMALHRQGPDLKSVFALARESQQSLKPHDAGLKREVEQRISKAISYQEVLQYLDSDLT
ncbi:MAG: hypothetical protein HRU33_24270 [Rhodobacteraceae bacterium]|nr:hypothetical protein [Paracoccaceae bacterium]